ncbi:MAG: FkbM family methyltransferase [Planctomycetota bacterium]|jgi:FkbM family methyltransferase
MAGREVTDGWYDDDPLIASLPPHMRLYARYSRAMVNRSTGVVRGGSFLFRMMRRLTPLLRLPRVARVRVGPRRAWVDLTDQRVLWVFDELRGAGHEHRVLQQLLRSGDTFLDVGANHGSYAILAAPLVGRPGMVVAVEPQPRLAQLIERSLSEAGEVRFTVHAAGLGDHDAQLTLHVPRAGSGAASLLPEYAPGDKDTIAVPVHRADTYLPWRDFPGRLLLKLDVEGSELGFLRGAATMIRDRRPFILFELNPHSAAAAGEEPRAVLKALRALGYDRCAELQAFPDTLPIASTPHEPQRNVLALPEAQ